MNLRKILIGLVFTAVAIAVVSLFWKRSELLIAILIVLSLLKQKLAPIKGAFLWFIVVSILGPVVEIFVMSFGGNPWAYALPSLFGAPLWLFPLYGLAGTTFITLYEGFFSLK